MAVNDTVIYSSKYRFKMSFISSDNISKAHFNSWHYDTNLVLAYFKQAMGEVKIEGNSYHVSDGDIIILNHNEIHSVHLEELPGERITLYLNENILDDHGDGAREMLSPFYKRALGTQNYISAAESRKLGIDVLIENVLNELSQKNDICDLLAFTGVVRILNILYKRSSVFRADRDKHFSNPIIEESIKYISSNFLNDIDIESISKNIGVSKYHLSRLFKESVGIGLWEYVISKRLFYFNEQVKKGMSIQNAALASGFNNYSNFYRLYKKHMHISPEDFKKSIKQ